MHRLCGQEGAAGKFLLWRLGCFRLRLLQWGSAIGMWLQLLRRDGLPLRQGEGSRRLGQGRPFGQDRRRASD